MRLDIFASGLVAMTEDFPGLQEISVVPKGDRLVEKIILSKEEWEKMEKESEGHDIRYDHENKKFIYVPRGKIS